MAKTPKQQFSITWIFAIPSALQVLSQIYGVMLYQGILGLLLVNWQKLTRAFWEFWLSLVDIETAGLEPVFDALTLTLTLFLVGFSARMRGDHLKLDDRLSQRFRGSGWPGLLPIMTTAFFLSLLLLCFSLELIENKNARSIGLNLSVYFVFSLMGLAAYYSYDRAKLVGPESPPFSRFITGPMIIVLGLVATGTLLSGALLGLVVAYLSFWPIMINSRYLEYVDEVVIAAYALSIAFAAIMHFLANWPSRVAIIKDGERLGGLLLACLTCFGLTFHFLAKSDDLGVQAGNLHNYLLLFVLVSFPLAALFCIKSNWRSIQLIFLIGVSLLIVDQTLTFAKEFITSMTG